MLSKFWTYMTTLFERSLLFKLCVLLCVFTFFLAIPVTIGTFLERMVYDQQWRETTRQYADVIATVTIGQGIGNELCAEIEKSRNIVCAYLPAPLKSDDYAVGQKVKATYTMRRSHVKGVSGRTYEIETFRIDAITRIN